MTLLSINRNTGDPELMTLVFNKVPPNVEHFYDLLQASGSGSVSEVRRILEAAGKRPYGPPPNIFVDSEAEVRNAIKLAVEGGHIEVLKAFVDFEVSFEDIQDLRRQAQRDHFWYEVLQQKLGAGTTDVATFLMNEVAGVGALVLFIAAAMGDADFLDQIKTCCREGSNPALDIKTLDGMSAYSMAQSECDDSVPLRLLRNRFIESEKSSSNEGSERVKFKINNTSPDNEKGYKEMEVQVDGKSLFRTRVYEDDHVDPCDLYDGLSSLEVKELGLVMEAKTDWIDRRYPGPRGRHYPLVFHFIIDPPKFEAFKLLVSLGANTELTTRSNGTGDNLLHYVIKKAPEDLLLRLLEEEGDLVKAQSSFIDSDTGLNCMGILIECVCKEVEEDGYYGMYCL